MVASKPITKIIYRSTCFVFLFIFVGSCGAVQALSQEDINSIYNDSVWYEPSSGGDSSTCLSGSGNEEQTWNYLISKNLTPPQVAGIMGNLRAESGNNPRRVEDGWGFPKEMDTVPPLVGPQGQPGFGIVQWTSPGRKQGLSDKSTSTGLKASDLGLQLDYMWNELTNTHSYIATYNKIKQSSDYKEVSDIFGHEYEGYGTNTEGTRRTYAFQILTQYGSGSTGGTDAGCASAGSIQLDPNFSMTKISPPMATPGGQITPKGITLHWWGSSSNGRGISALVSALRGNTSCGASGCSVQIGITADGKIYQMTKNLTDLTYHAIGANQTTFGIEIEGGPSDFGQAGINKYPKKFEAVVATVKYLVSHYHLPLDGNVICGDVSGIHPHKAYNKCPGAIQKIDIDDVYFNAVMQKVRQ